MLDQRTPQRPTRSARPHRSSAWSSLTAEEKQLRLAGLRRRQQHQIEVELRMLRDGGR